MRAPFLPGAAPPSSAPFPRYLQTLEGPPRPLPRPAVAAPSLNMEAFNEYALEHRSSALETGAKNVFFVIRDINTILAEIGCPQAAVPATANGRGRRQRHAAAGVEAGGVEELDVKPGQYSKKVGCSWLASYSQSHAICPDNVPPFAPAAIAQFAAGQGQEACCGSLHVPLYCIPSPTAGAEEVQLGH